MSEINANIIVDPITLTVQQNDPGLTITPDVTSLNIYAGGYAQPQGNVGELQYNKDGASLGGAANTLVTSGNLRFTNLANLKINGGANAYFLQTDGTGNLTWAQGTANVSGNGTAAGANTQIQLSDGTGNFDSAPGFRFDSASNIFYTPGNAEITGNVTANFYFGDGGLLSNLPGGTFIANGNSNVQVYANSNVAVSITGVSNTVVFTNTGVNATGYLSVTGNTTSNNFIGPLANGNSNIRILANSDILISLVGVANRVVFDHNAARFISYPISQQQGANNIGIDNGRISMGLENQTLGMVTRVYNNNTSDTARTEFYRTRGNTNVPTAVIANDEISNLRSYVYADSGNQNYNTTTLVDTVNSNDNNGNVVSTFQIKKHTTGDKIELYSPLVKVTSNGSNNTLLYGNGDITTIGNITANIFSGNANGLSNIPGANVTGTVANANFATTANNAYFAGNVTNAAQPNITSVGTLGNLTVSGNIGTNNFTATNFANANNMNVTANLSAGNVKTDNLLYANGVPWDLEQPGGSNTDIQFNDNGDLGGSNAFTFDKTSNIVNVAANLNANNLNASNFVIAGNIFANSGTVGANLLTGTLTTNNQPNITNIGTLGNLTVTGNIVGANLRGNLANGNSSVTIPTANGNINITANGGDNEIVVSSGNVLIGANLRVSRPITADQGLTSVTGNITALYATVTLSANASSQPNITSVGSLTGLTMAANADITLSGSGSNISGANLISASYLSGTLTASVQPNIVVVGTLSNLTANGNITTSNGFFVGDGTYITNISIGAGTYIENGNSNIFVFANSNATVSIAGVANTVKFTSSGANFLGNVQANGFLGTIYTAAQPNITSLGTLIDLSVAGNINANNITTNTFTINGTFTTTDLVINNNKIHLGIDSGNASQGNNAIAIGNAAGNLAQSNGAIAIGANAGGSSQNSQLGNAIAIGTGAGRFGQENGAIAIGVLAGTPLSSPTSVRQGQDSIAIGSSAGSDSNTSVGMPNNSICLNATGSALKPNAANTFFVRPIRQASNLTGLSSLYYNPSTGEIVYYP